MQAEDSNTQTNFNRYPNKTDTMVRDSICMPKEEADELLLAFNKFDEAEKGGFGHLFVCASNLRAFLIGVVLADIPTGR